MGTSLTTEPWEGWALGCGSEVFFFLGFFIFVLNGGCHIRCSGAVLSSRELSVRLQAAGAGAGKNSGGRVFV